MNLVVSPAAQADLLAAARWYEEREDGLAARFLGDVETTLGRISSNPKAFPKAHLGLRRALVQRFPYSVYFDIGPTDIAVLAVLHQKQDVAVLEQRLNDAP